MDLEPLVSRLRRVVGTIGGMAHQGGRNRRVLPLLLQQQSRSGRAEGQFARRPMEITTLEVDDSQRHKGGYTLLGCLRPRRGHRRERRGLDHLRRPRPRGRRYRHPAQECTHCETEALDDRHRRLDCQDSSPLPLRGQRTERHRRQIRLHLLFQLGRPQGCRLERLQEGAGHQPFKARQMHHVLYGVGRPDESRLVGV